MAAGVKTSLTVLGVDDDALVLKALERSMFEGTRFIPCVDPVLALDMFEKQNIDVIISDMEMPKLNGLELVTHVRQRFPEVIRILITGEANLPMVLKAINDGEVFRFLTKPWDNDELAKVMTDAAERIRQTRGGPASTGPTHQAELLEALESAFPGITQVDRSEDGYVIANERITRALETIAEPVLTALWTTPS